MNSNYINILQFKLRNFQKKLSILDKKFRGIAKYPFIGLVDNMVVHNNGEFTISYKILTQSTQLIGNDSYHELVIAWSKILKIPDVNIKIEIKGKEYILYISSHKKSSLKKGIETIKSILNSKNIELEMIKQYTLPDICTESLAGNYIEENTSGDHLYSRFFYLEFVPGFAGRMFDDLQIDLSDQTIYIEYYKLNKNSFIKKIDSSNDDFNSSDNKSITSSLAEQDKLASSTSGVGAKINSDSIPVSMKVFVKLSASSVSKLNKLTDDKIKYLQGYKFISMWGEQMETSLYLCPFSSAKLKRNTSFDNWVEEISLSMPLMWKTMDIRGELPIGDGYSSPLALTDAKSMFIIGKSRTGKTYLTKKVIKLLIEKDYRVYIIDRNLPDDPNIDYSDVPNTNREKFEYNDISSFLSYISKIFKDQQEEFANNSTNTKNTLIVVDEAWQFIQDSILIRDIIQRIARDGSKFNLGILFITQSIRDLEVLSKLGVIEQIGVRFFFGLPEGTAEILCRDEFQLPENAISLIGQLTQGECVSQILQIKNKYNAIDYVKVL